MEPQNANYSQVNYYKQNFIFNVVYKCILTARMCKCKGYTREHTRRATFSQGCGCSSTSPEYSKKDGFVIVEIILHKIVLNDDRSCYVRTPSRRHTVRIVIQVRNQLPTA